MTSSSLENAAKSERHCSPSRLWLHGFVIAAALVGDSAASAAEPRNLARPLEQGGLPFRVHVVEDYETEIEKRWFMRGQVVEDQVPTSLSASVANRRSCRATETKDFDDKMGDANVTYKAVIFNPVPGPPMSGQTRLNFRYRLHGTDTIRVQIYSLTNGYHRSLTLTSLTQDRWQAATVDMTQARRPDGSGGPLAADERIDDIQFYIDRAADLWIDDIVLFDAGAADEAGRPAKNNAQRREPFPRRIIFTGWFDTGKQGAGHEWPGRFEIVPHEPPRNWKAARSVFDEKTRQARLEIALRGSRRLSEQTRLRFRYRLTGGDAIEVALVDSKSGKAWRSELENVPTGRWDEAFVDFPIESGEREAPPPSADAVHFSVSGNDAVLWVDDVLLYEPAEGRNPRPEGAQPQ
jgi:hypothetical protein